MMAAQMILDLLMEKGAVPAQPGEFTKRAFLHGKWIFPRRRLWAS